MLAEELTTLKQEIKTRSEEVRTLRQELSVPKASRPRSAAVNKTGSEAVVPSLRR